MRSADIHHILIVDDDDEDRYIIDFSFRQICWEDHIKLIDSGDSMFRHLDALSNSSSYPALILLDYNMPRMGAEEIISRLRRNEQYNGIEVVVYSTAMTEVLCNRLKTLGAVECFNKFTSVDAAIELADNLKRKAQKQQPIE